MSMEDRNKFKIGGPISAKFCGPITIEEYIYRVKIDDSGICIKAKNKHTFARYLCFVSPESMKKCKTFHEMEDFYNCICNLLIDKYFHDNRRSSNNPAKELKLNYCGKEDRIIMEIVISYWNIYDNVILSLDKKQTIEEKIMSKNKFNNYEHSQQVSKVSDLEENIILLKKTLVSMSKEFSLIKEDYKLIKEELTTTKQELDTLKIETADSKYMAIINYFDASPNLGTYGGWDKKCFDVREIRTICVGLVDKRLFLVNVADWGREITLSSIPSSHFAFPKNEKSIKYIEYLKFFDKLGEYEGHIYSFGINIFEYIAKCKKIRKLTIFDYKGDLDMNKVLNFPKLEALEIINSGKINNMNVLEKHGSLKTLTIDHVPQSLIA